MDSFWNKPKIYLFWQLMSIPELWKVISLFFLSSVFNFFRIDLLLTKTKIESAKIVIWNHFNFIFLRF